MNSSEFLTVPEVAKLLRVRPDKVLTWVRSGKLKGFNVAEKENSQPRYRVSREALGDFIHRRTEYPQASTQKYLKNNFEIPKPSLR
jgi:excisionase family DNA binding protein